MACNFGEGLNPQALVACEGAIVTLFSVYLKSCYQIYYYFEFSETEIIDIKICFIQIVPSSSNLRFRFIVKQKMY